MDSSKRTAPAHVVPHTALSAAAHELRGCLGVTRGYLRMLGKSPGLDAPGRKAVDAAGRAADRMAALLDEISHYARWAGGEYTLAPAPTDVGAVLNAAARAAALPKEPAIRVRVADPGLTAAIDAGRITDTCAALVGALARAQTGPTAILVSAAPADGAFIEVLIALDGAFVEARDRAPNLDRPGAGLAIPLAELLARLHGGALTELWVRDDWAGYRMRLSTRL